MIKRVVDDDVDHPIKRVKKVKRISPFKPKIVYKAAEIESEEINKEMTIEEYNFLPIKSKQSINNYIISKVPNERTIKFFTNLNNFIQYLTIFEETEKLNFIEISGEKDEYLIPGTKDKYQINILSDLTEILFINKLFESIDFINHVRALDDFVIEIRYPSPFFEELYRSVLRFKKEQFDNKNDVQIFIFISKIEVTDLRFSNDKSITKIKLDDCIISIRSKRNENSHSGSFQNCTSFKKILIPSSVTTIGKSAFYGCSSFVCY